MFSKFKASKKLLSQKQVSHGCLLVIKRSLYQRSTVLKPLRAKAYAKGAPRALETQKEVLRHVQKQVQNLWGASSNLWKRLSHQPRGFTVAVARTFAECGTLANTCTTKSAPTHEWLGCTFATACGIHELQPVEKQLRMSGATCLKPESGTAVMQSLSRAGVVRRSITSAISAGWQDLLSAG